jgi:hypothetical protein
MSVAYCLPLPSSVTRQRWFVVVLLVVLAALSPRLAEALAATASIMAVVSSGPKEADGRRASAELGR